MKLEDLTIEQRRLMIQRLTALWAFSESGLGGMLHALQVPFTGLVVGGMAVILISFIGYLSQDDYKQIFKSLIIVLLVKVAVSPHTPFPAYIAVSFQAALGYWLFKFFRINLFSIMLLCILAMVESAIQKILLLTLFFGKSLVKAADELLNFIGKQFSVSISNGGIWIITAYILIYIIGGIVTGFAAWKMIKSFSFQSNTPLPSPKEMIFQKSNKSRRTIFILLIASLVISLLLLLLASKEYSLYSVITAFAWTVTAILLWYAILAPLLTKAFIKFLQKNSSKYSNEIEETLSFLPILNQLTLQAWQQSKAEKRMRRIPVFINTLLHWSLLYKAPETES